MNYELFKSEITALCDKICDKIEQARPGYGINPIDFRMVCDNMKDELCDFKNTLLERMGEMMDDLKDHFPS